MLVRRGILAPLLILGIIAAAQAAGILGEWRGTSTCADKVAYSACTDEVVVYDARAGATADTVILRADKIVAGRREPMGEGPFVRDSAGAWSSEFRTPRFHGRWSVTVRGDSMTGTLTDLEMHRLVRHVALRRVPAR